MSTDVDFARIYSHYLLFKKDPDSYEISGLELNSIDDSNLFDSIC